MAQLARPSRLSTATLLMPLSMAVMLGGIAGAVLTPTGPVIGIVSFFATTLVLAMTAWSIADQPGPDPLDVRVLDAAILALAFMAVAVLIFGTLGLLGWWMLVVTTGMTGSMWAMFDSRFGLVLHRSSPGRLNAGFVTALSLGCAAFAVFQAVLGRIFRPPIGDSLAYHLPFAVEWLQTGTLDMPVPAAGDPSTTFYPLNSSAWIFWLMTPFESEILARFVQLPFLFLLGLATYRIARELRLPTSAGMMTAALATTVPAIARSASLPENDLIMAALLVTATAYLFLLGSQFTVWRAAMAALVIGLAVGTKVIALAFGGVLGLIWIALVVRGRRSGGLWSVVRMLSVGAVIVVAVGGYSYLRNAVMMGNPLYPAGYDLPGDYGLEGLYFPTWEWRQSHAFFAFDWDAFLFGSRRDFGWTVTFWAIPGVVLAGILALIGLALPSRSRRDAQGLIPVLWVAVSLLIFWYIVPYHFSRFLFPSIVIAIIAGMWALDRLARLIEWRWLEVWYPSLALPVIVANLVNVPIDPSIRDRALYWIAAAVVIGGTFGMLLLARAVPGRTLRVAVFAAGGLVVLGLTVGWSFYHEEYDDRRLAEWRSQIQGFSQTPDAWEWIELETEGEDTVVAIAGTNEIYPFYGPRLDNEVVTIWSSGELAEYGWFDVYRHFGEPERERWEQLVNEEDVDYVVVTEDVSFGGWPPEKGWMESSPERFLPGFENDEIEVWIVQDAEAETGGYTDERVRLNASDRRRH